MAKAHHHWAIFWVSLGLLVMIAIAFSQYYLFAPAPNPPERVILRVEPGMSAKRVGRDLKRLGLVRSELMFRFLAKIRAADAKIQPGVYPFEKGMSPLDVLLRLEKPGGEGGEVCFREGLTIAQYTEALKEIGVDSLEFVMAAHDRQLLAQFRINASSAEGYLFPDTYQMLPGVLPREAVKRMLARFREVVPDSMDSIAAAKGMTLHEMITLASIVEAEVQKKSEAPLVSAVYTNRLKKKMLLQADPTIQYILPGPPRRLLFRDLEVDSPYNTYMYTGLPPGPICNPGKNAILAAFNPADVDYLYFVSQADGSHAFNKNLSGHLKSKVVLDSARKVLSLHRIAERDSLKRAKAASVPQKDTPRGH